MVSYIVTLTHNFIVNGVYDDNSLMNIILLHCGITR